MKISMEQINKYLQGATQSDYWFSLEEEKKNGAVALALSVVRALGYRIDDASEEEVVSSISLEALARTFPQGVAARRAAQAGVVSASAGHASERYDGAGGGLWDATARAILRPYRMCSASIVRGTS